MADDADTLRELQIGRWRYEPDTQTLTFDAVGREILDLDAGALSVDEWAERYPHAGARDDLPAEWGLSRGIHDPIRGRRKAPVLYRDRRENSGSRWGTVQDVTRFVRIGSDDAVPHSVLTRSELMKRGQALFAQGKTYAVLAMDVGHFRNSSGHRNRGEFIEWVGAASAAVHPAERSHRPAWRTGIRAGSHGSGRRGGPANRAAGQRGGSDPPVGGGTGAFHIGYTVVNRDDLSFADTLSRADQALYMARNGASGEPALY